MKRLLACVALVGALALGAGAVIAQEKAPAEGHKGAAVTLSDAAAKAIKAAFPNAKVGTVTMAGRGDNKLYSAMVFEGDKKFTVSVSESGVIVRVVMAAAIADLPKAVTDAVNAASAGAEIASASKVEQRADPKTLTALEKAKISYEIRFTEKEGRRNSMIVAADGTVIRAPRAPKVQPPQEKPAPPT